MPFYESGKASMSRRSPGSRADGSASYVEPQSGAHYPLHLPRWCADDGSPLMITPLRGIGRRRIARAERSIWRYAESLPWSINEPISMGEGCTPLISHHWGKISALCKLEWFAPTGSFKDRGASVMLSVLRQQGIRAVLEDSSGNGGAAIAAYASAGGMRSKILVPASTPSAKTVHMRVSGAEVELVAGTRQDTADEAIKQSSRIFYASHNWQPAFLQGTKTLAYELWEDLGYRAPDNVIVPLGAGSNVLGCSIGFSELLRAGAIDRMPRIFGVQPVNCAPIHASYVAGSDQLQPVEIKPTIAEGTAIARPIRLVQVLQALRESAGATVAVTEVQITSACMGLAASGLYVEPTSATTAAALSQLLRQKAISARQRTVLVMTGTGIKATQRVSDLLEGRA
jgi:threonine synthase